MALVLALAATAGILAVGVTAQAVSYAKMAEAQMYILQETGSLGRVEPFPIADRIPYDLNFRWTKTEVKVYDVNSWISAIVKPLRPNFSVLAPMTVPSTSPFALVPIDVVQQRSLISNTPVIPSASPPTTQRSDDCCPAISVMNSPDPGLSRQIDWSSLGHVAKYAILAMIPLVVYQIITTFKMEMVPAINYMTDAEKDRWRGLIDVDGVPPEE